MGRHSQQVCPLSRQRRCPPGLNRPPCFEILVSITQRVEYIKFREPMWIYNRVPDAKCLTISWFSFVTYKKNSSQWLCAWELLLTEPLVPTFDKEDHTTQGRKNVTICCKSVQYLYRNTSGNKASLHIRCSQIALIHPWSAGLKVTIWAWSQHPMTVHHDVDINRIGYTIKKEKDNKMEHFVIITWPIKNSYFSISSGTVKAPISDQTIMDTWREGGTHQPAPWTTMNALGKSNCWPPVSERSSISSTSSLRLQSIGRLAYGNPRASRKCNVVAASAELLRVSNSFFRVIAAPPDNL